MKTVAVVLLLIVASVSISHCEERESRSPHVSIIEIAKLRTLPDDVAKDDSTDYQVQDLAFSPDGKYIAAICTHSELQVFDVEKRRRIHTMEVAHGDFFGVQFGIDGKMVITDSHVHFAHTSTVQAWSIASGERLWARSFSDSTNVELGGDREALVLVRNIRDGKMSVAAHFELATGKQTSFWETIAKARRKPHIREHGIEVRRAENDTSFKIVDIAKGRVLWAKSGDYRVKHFHITPSGTLVVCGTRQVDLYEVNTGKRLNKLTSSGHDWFAMHPEDQIHPQSWLIATTKSDRELCFHDALTGKLIETLNIDIREEFAECPMVFSPDGRYFAEATSPEGRLRLIKIEASSMPNVPHADVVPNSK